MATVLGANTLSTGGFQVDNSVRFDGSSAYMTLTPGSAGSQKIVTFSTWIKRSQLGEGDGPADVFMMYGYAGSNSDTRLYFTGDGDGNDDRLYFQSTTSNTTHTALATNRKFRDPNAWYHIVINFNSSVGSPDTNHVEMFINGVKETSFATETYPSQNDVVYWTDDSLHTIGRRSDGGNLWYGGYMAETVMIDGQALDADSFGEFDEDTGIWKPIDVSGLTFGTNGFYLEYKGSGTSANSSGLGADTSGNDHHFAVSGLAAIDQTTDTCTNNFCTLNILDNFFPNHTYTDGNLTSASGTADGSPYTYVTSSMGFNTGKWYWEFKAVAKESGIDNWVPGFTSQRTTTTTLVNANNTHGYGMYGHSGVIYNDGSSAYGDGFTTGNTVMIAVDMDNLAAYWGVNGTWDNSSDPESGSSRTGAKVITAPTGDIGVYVPSWHWYEADVNGTASFNFGSPPYAISSGNADGNGFGNFEYAVPSGYLAICTKNLAESG